MSSDGYFEDDLDSAIFNELDAIEAAALAAPAKRPPPNAATQLGSDDSFCDMSFDIDEGELARIDNFIQDSYQGKAQPVAGPSNHRTVQTTLFGGVVPQPKASTSKANTTSRPPLEKTRSTQRTPFGRQASKTKQWDQTAFAKSGWKLDKSKSKGKGKARYDDSDEEDEENVEFEQFPAPFVSIGPPPPMKLTPDLLEAKHWIFPLNQPKRDYQYNIVKHCLFDNTLVAIPTGLGKTFIAGVVMLNFYRWFPEGKVIFVAPTKPLVAQQIFACHKTCGIPGNEAIELTGNNPKPMRLQAWNEKRIFYMTPQTLMNDLASETCDVSKIVLLVIDEAHRGTGDYAYAQVIRFLMAKNPHFRVLALTATPGSKPEAVQKLVDNLHISRIEIRDEDSLDLKAYTHTKKLEPHMIKMDEAVNKIKDRLVALMDSYTKPLLDRRVLEGYFANAVTMHSFAMKSKKDRLQKDQRWAYSLLSKLEILARAMGYLIEGTIGMCYTYLLEISKETDEDEDGGSRPPKKKAPPSKAKKWRDEPLFRALMTEIETQKHPDRGLPPHPKMDKLKALVIQHFAENMGDNDEVEGKRDENETRVMVFTTFRECVGEIVETLNLERPLIRATAFIGQGVDKQGKKGLAQKEQLAVIQKFKAGELNVLVATSIGEEGLDIGEVDLIVCYDATKTPIRMLQRAGRTGRQRQGVVHVLLSEFREEHNLEKAKTAYKDVQKTIRGGEQFELYGDVERLLPDHIKPEPLEKVMEIQEYVREDGRKKGSFARGGDSLQKGTKRKRNDDLGRNIPDGASAGFVSVAQLVAKGAKKRKKVTSPKDFELAGQDDDTDMDIEAGILPALTRRTVSSAASTSRLSAPKAKPRLKKAATLDEKSTQKKRKSRKVVPQLTSSQFSRKGLDDEDDMDIEQGIFPQVNSHPSPRHRSSSPSSSRPSSPDVPDVKTIANNSVIELTDSEGDSPPPNNVASSKPLISPSQSSKYWSSSPNIPLVRVADQFVIELTDSELDPRSSPGIVPASPGVANQEDRDSMAWLIDEDDEPNLKIASSSPVPDYNDSVHIQPRSSTRTENSRFDRDLPAPPADLFDDESIEFVIKNSVPASPKSSPPWNLSSSPPRSPPPRSRPAFRRPDMPPPNGLPARFNVPSPVSNPEPSFSIRPLQPKKRPIQIPEPDSSLELDMPPPSQRRLHRQRESSPARRPKKRAPVLQRRNPLLDVSAAHSGDEISEGSSNSEDDVESESDRRFIHESPGTQVSPSYNQALAYRQSLLTQAPSTARVPAFARPPRRRGAFGPSTSRLRPVVSSSPPPLGSEPDEYSLGSFVVHDEAEISYIDSDEP